MDDALLVRGFERFGDLSRDLAWPRRAATPRARCARERSSPSTSSITSAWMRALAGGRAFLEAVDLRDVRMVQRRKRLGFAPKALQPIGIPRELVAEDLQRDVAMEPRVTRAIHLAHPTCAERRDNLVGTKRTTGFQSQWPDYRGAGVID